jgi:hypothetical protein
MAHTPPISPSRDETCALPADDGCCVHARRGGHSAAQLERSDVWMGNVPALTRTAFVHSSHALTSYTLLTASCALYVLQVSGCAWTDAVVSLHGSHAVHSPPIASVPCSHGRALPTVYVYAAGLPRWRLPVPVLTDYLLTLATWQVSLFGDLFPSIVLN